MSVRRSLIAAVLVLAVPAMVGAEGAEDLDPLLRLLVDKGVLTLEEAFALEVEAAARADQPAAAPAPPPPAAAAVPARWYDRLKVAGDVRLRYEGFSQDGAFDDDRRDRFRLRLRAGIEAAVSDALRLGFAVRSGEPDDPVSNNISFDDAFQAKPVNLAEVYLELRLSRRAELVAGKLDPKERWTVSDLQWDDDVTVEGVMAKLLLGSGDALLGGLELVPYAFILEESGSGRDAYVFGGQARADLAVGADQEFAVGAGFDLWDHPQAVVDQTLSGRLGGNAVTNLLDGDRQLVSDFEILNLFAEWRHRGAGRWPVTVNLFYYKNLGARGAAADQDTGHFGRVQVGESKTLGQVAFRYSFYRSEPDALFYVFTQSDTARSSDVEAHRLDLRVGLVARSYVNLTWYHSRPALAEDEPLDRWQVDYIVRF